MAIACPYCEHRLNLKSPLPGRYHPKCPNCAKAFLLWVPAEAGTGCRVRGLGDTDVQDPREPAGRQSTAAFVLAVPSGSSDSVSASQSPASGLSNCADSGARESGFARTNPEDALASTPGERSASADTEDDFLLPNTEIRGYAIERELGRGGMGAVYLARQLSLDRPVALKVMSKRWANDPVFVARFTREAYAAAQLSHPNIVQIHDIGEADGARFFSMEFVPGKSLADIVRSEGKLDPETAVGYILQAARGLKHAHDRGMIHRDVKPDNLLLDEHGLVKVADLGLVKTPTTPRGDDRPRGSGGGNGLLSLPSEMTGARIALGTPAYMSPEQCRDAATVDHRADIYSLGCTLYVLVTGRPPFDGTTAVELMTKHAYDPVVPPEQIVSRVPREVSAVIQRMMAKHADDRFQTMGEVIRTLEGWLGVHHAGTFSPREEHISRLEGYVVQFNTCATAVLRGRLVAGFFGAVALSAVLLAFFGKLGWAFGVFGLALQATLAYFVLDGIARKSHLFGRVREFVFGVAWGDWALAAAGLALFLVLLALSNVFWIWVGFGLIGIGLAFALRYGVDRPLAEERRAAVEGCERLLRRMRMHGVDEEELRQFVAKFAGRNWEEFFEALFGFEAKMAARAMLLRGGAAGAREKFAAWREPILAAVERVLRHRKEERERRLLQSIEQANLLAAGEPVEAAEAHAKAAADAMVRAAGEVHKTDTRVRIGAAQQTGAMPACVKTLAQGTAALPDPYDYARNTPDPMGRFVALFVGPHVRALGAALLLATCALWAYQNGLVPGAGIEAQATQALENNDLSSLQQQATFVLGRPTRPLALGGVPGPMTVWIDSFNVGLAGLLLLASLFFRGNLMSVLVLIGAAIAVVGHQAGIRPVAPFRDFHVSLMLGTVLALVGFRLGTR